LNIRWENKNIVRRPRVFDKNGRMVPGGVNYCEHEEGGHKSGLTRERGGGGEEKPGKLWGGRKSVRPDRK